MVATSTPSNSPSPSSTPSTPGGLPNGTYTMNGTTVTVKAGGNGPGGTMTPITRSAGGGTVKDLGGGIYVTGGGKLLNLPGSVPTPNQQASIAAATGQANFQTTTGEMEQVTYAQQSQTPGIITALQNKGYAGGTTFNLQQTSVQNFTPGLPQNFTTGKPNGNPTDKVNDFAALDYFYPLGSRAKGLSDTNIYNSLPSWLQSNSSRQPLYSLPQAKSPTGEFIYGVANIPNDLIRSPLPTMELQTSNSVNAFSTMFVVGAASGLFVEESSSVAASRFGTEIGGKAGAITEKTLGYVGVGIAGIGVLSNPKEAGSNLPAFIAGGAGFMGGYRTALPPPSITFKPTSRFTLAADSGSWGEVGRMVKINGEQEFSYNYKEFGLEKTGTTTARMEVVTPNQPTNKNIINYDINTRIDYTDLSGKQQVMKGNYKGVYDTDYGVFAGKNKAGNMFEVINSKPVYRSIEGMTSTEVVGVRTTSFANEKITSISEGLNNQEVTRTRNFNLDDYSKQQSIRVNNPIRGLNMDFSRDVIAGGSRSIKTTSSNVEILIPSQMRGIKLLQEQGLYREPMSSRLRASTFSLKENFNDRFLNPKVTRLYSGVILEPPIIRPIEVSKDNMIYRREIPIFNEIPIRSTGLSPKLTPFPLYGIKNGGSIIQSRNNKFYPKMSNPQIPNTIIAPKYDTTNIFGQSSAITTTPRVTTIPATTPGNNIPQIPQMPNPPTTIIPPNIPPIAPAIGMPMWGVGGGSSRPGHGGRSRFRYVTSLTAGLYHIRGPRPIIANPISIRPMPLPKMRRATSFKRKLR